MYDLPAFNARCNTVTATCRREQQGSAWSCDGQPSAPRCVQIAEPVDPHRTWTDNWLCGPEGLELEWSFAGEVPGKRCVGVREGAEPDDATWADNYLCWRRLSFDVDAQVGPYHEFHETECALPTDCMD